MRARPIAVALFVAACTATPAPTDGGADAPSAAPDAGMLRCPGPFTAPTANELAARHALGIPDEAQCVIVLSQTSHIDIDWRLTFDGYYSMWVESLFGSAHDLLAADPAYRYQVAEMAYLSHHLSVHPEQVSVFHDAATRGALRVVGGGMTSPDTLLPATETLVRDHLRGSLFAESALGAHPHDAWLPDSFGHSPTTPDLLAGMGYEGVAFARVDGLHDAAEVGHGTPRIVPGSTADQLTQMRSADFVWRGPGGGEVLAHWLPIRLYCQGDNIDHTGAPLPGGFALGNDMSDQPAYVDAQIAGYVSELTPYVRTPYMFVPVGCDFASPHVHLLDHIRRWNTERYPTNGVYLVPASFEEYVGLLHDRHGDLPTLSPDMSDYFSGFYGSRLALKWRIRDVGDRLVQTEMLAMFAERLAGATYPTATFGQAWDSLARSDHHDFITGTSADDVVTSEQLTLVESVRTMLGDIENTSLVAIAGTITADPSAVTSAIVVGTVGATRPVAASVQLGLPQGAAHDLGADVPSQILNATRWPDGSIQSAAVLLAIDTLAPAIATRIGFHDRASTGPVSTMDDGANVVLTDSSTMLRASIDHATGLLTSLTLSDVEQLSAPSLVLEHWTDDGGLYRIGSESSTCHFTDLGAISDAPTVNVVETGPARATVRITRGTNTIDVVLIAGLGRLDLSVQAAAANREAITLAVHTTTTNAHARFFHAGGSVERPSASLYTPSFWPVVRALDLTRADGSGIALLPTFSTGVQWAADGTLTILVSRNAPVERCDILGQDGTEVVHDPLAMSLRPHGAAIDPLAEAMALLQAPAVQLSGTGGTHTPPIALLGLGGHGWVLSALKHAERGAGVVLRVERTDPTAMLTWAPALIAPTASTRTDLLERDGAAATSPLALDAPLVTLRLTE
jgi:hypothetical protein